MPEMDGYEAATAIRAESDSGTHVPIIAMTAYAMPDDRERCLQAVGMDDYIRKPVKAEVLQTIQQWGRPAPGGARLPEVGPQLSALAVDSLSPPLGFCLC